jgi:endo-1,4-beta-D-glucanase Y
MNGRVWLFAAAVLACTACMDSAVEDESPLGAEDLGTSEAAVSCGSGGVNNPFGTHARAYVAGILPSHKTAAQRDATTKAFYNTWKSKYLKKGCGSTSGHPRYYVDSGMDDSRTVSEAHGYGMLLTAYFAGYDTNAKVEFDGLYYFFKAHQSTNTPYLMAWSQAKDSACTNNQGPDSATDGDLDIAYALLLADKQWGSTGTINYKAEAKKVITAIKSGESVDQAFLTLGDWTGTSGSGDSNSTRSSDFMPGHFKSFAAVIDDGAWTNILNRSYTTMQQVVSSSSSSGLLPDFIVSPRSNPKPAPGGFLEGANDGKYYYNACRDPLRIAVHYLTTGDTRARNMVQKMNVFIKAKTGGNPDKIRAGYSLSGSPLSNSDFFTNAFAAPFAVGAMVDGSNQTWLNKTYDAVVAQAPEEYYEDTIKMLSLLIMSGNWWTPEAAPCN